LKTTSEAWTAVALRPHSIDQRLAKALTHAVREQALRLLATGPTSPKEIATELGLDVRTVAYHVRVLRELGCIELIETRQRRGAVEHVYRIADWALPD
jgi:DNA-binding transcriptional ArsR family regulator